MSTFLIVISGMAVLGALILAFMSRQWAAPVAWVAMLSLFFTTRFSPVELPGLLFWGLAALIVLGIGFLSGPGFRIPRVANAYMMAGALVGAIVGMLISSAALVLGAAIGAFFGAVAYSRTPGGRGLQFPGRAFWQILMVSGLPAVVVMSIVGHVVAGWLTPVG